jgi:hypothetical protein
MKKIKHNDLVPWFIQDHGTLPASYLKSCRSFFDSIKLQASSIKPQASIQKNLHKPGTRVKNRFNRKI